MIYLGSVDFLSKDTAIQGEGSYEYVGSFKSLTSRNRMYVFHCKICAKDPELFGDSLFYTNKSDFLKGQPFCGCAKVVSWTENQAFVKCERSASIHGILFHHMDLPYNGTYTKVHLSCKDCGHSWSASASTLWGRGSGCLMCRNRKASAASKAKSKISDLDRISSFQGCGFYGKEKSFIKIERLDTYGRSNYWLMRCSKCGESIEAQQGNILKGTVRCGCIREGQKECYINIIYDGELPIALKFGISKDSVTRLQQHNYISDYDHKLFAVYQFESVNECRSAERYCKNNIQTGVIDKQIMSVGWTETCDTSYLEFIMKILFSMGGKRIL